MQCLQGGGLNVLALCAGYGGLELGIRALWPDARTICYVEREAYAAAVLVSRMEAEQLDAAPVWSDLANFDGQPWRGKVDCVTAGFPCQPHSLAGARKGLDDERWLWPAIVRVIRDIRPSIVILENVPGIVTSGGLPACLGDLAAFGFDAEWGCLPAAAVGAPHKRDRLFLVAADPDSARLEKRRCLAGHDGARFAAAIGNGSWWRQHEAPEPCLRRMADGDTTRVDRLRLIGNGVVPQQAAEAIRQLWRRLAWTSNKSRTS